jgi:hypothetical protein
MNSDIKKYMRSINFGFVKIKKRVGEEGDSAAKVLSKYWYGESIKYKRVRRKIVKYLSQSTNKLGHEFLKWKKLSR